MADQSAAVSGYGATVWHPGNPQFPTLPLPGDPVNGFLDNFAVGAQFEFFDQPLPDQPPFTSAAKVGGYAGWYLDQIWASPVPIDFGDIADQKDVEVTLYSTYRTAQTISSVVIPVSGVNLLTPSIPVSIRSFGDEIFTFRAAQSGPQSFDDEIEFTTPLIDFVIRTLGQRVLVLLASPQAGIAEQLLFKTDLMRSKNGFEQAFNLRKAPRARIQFTYRLSDLNDKKRTELETVLFAGNPLLPIGVQYWWEARKITSAALSTDTIVNFLQANMSIAAGDTLVFTTPDDTNIIATILDLNSPEGFSVTLEDQIGTALPLGTYVTPVRYGHMVRSASIGVARKNMEDLQVELTTEAERDIGEIDTNYFDLYTIESPMRPILKERCTTGGLLSGTIEREQSILDSQTGRFFVTGTEALGQQSTEAIVYINDSDKLYAWRKFLHYIRGSWGTFYAPTFQNDLPLFAPFTLGGNTFVVPYMGLTTLIGGIGAAPKRDLRIVIADGSVHYRRINTLVDNGNGTETITLDSTVGSGSPEFSPIASTFISWMHLVRLVGDSASFLHTTIGEADLRFRIRTVKE
ncbi:MAG: hypothetical protein E4G91_00375 [Candidatus Zixiibacteriota bacterium]|nr:MAG: hypothetical protein E4G91_00375 [candidate division Zixibacteria bacterium]